VNALLEKGLVEQRPNPRHKRSPLVRLTAEGRTLFRTILRRDERAVRRTTDVYRVTRNPMYLGANPGWIPPHPE